MGDTLPKQCQMDALSLHLNLEQRDMQSKNSRMALPSKCSTLTTWLLPQDSDYHSTFQPLEHLDSAQARTSSFLSIP